MYENVTAKRFLQNVPDQRLYNLLYCGFEADDPELMGPIFLELSRREKYTLIRKVIGERRLLPLDSQTTIALIELCEGLEGKDAALFDLGTMMKFAQTEFSRGLDGGWYAKFNVIRDCQEPKTVIGRTLFEYFNSENPRDGWKQQLTRGNLRKHADAFYRDGKVDSRLDKRAMDITIHLVKSRVDAWSKLIEKLQNPASGMWTFLQVNAFEVRNGYADRM